MTLEVLLLLITRSELQGPQSDGTPFAVKLSFYELVNRAGFSSTYQDKVYWEVWKIQLKVVAGSHTSTGVIQHQVNIVYKVPHMLHRVQVLDLSSVQETYHSAQHHARVLSAR